MYLMIVGPYRSGTKTDGERANNLAVLNDAALKVFKKGHCPIVSINIATPLVNLAGVDEYDVIVKSVAKALALKCDGVLRVDGHSSSADLEVELVRSRGGIVFNTIDEIPTHS